MSGSFAKNFPASGVKAIYHLDGNLNDSSGNGNHIAPYYGSVSVYNHDLFEHVPNTNSASFIYKSGMGTGTNLDLPLSHTFWFRLDQGTMTEGTGILLWTCNTASKSAGMVVVFESGVYKWQITFGYPASTSRIRIADSRIAVGKWNFVDWQSDGNTAYLYVNGQYIGSYTKSGTGNAGGSYIPIDNQYVGTWANRSYGEVVIRTSTRTAHDHRMEYANTTGKLYT
jgi:hypothetical protein